jgi:hypothetical protein
VLDGRPKLDDGYTGSAGRGTSAHNATLRGLDETK